MSVDERNGEIFIEYIVNAVYACLHNVYMLKFPQQIVVNEVCTCLLMAEMVKFSQNTLCMHVYTMYTCCNFHSRLL